MSDESREQDQESWQDEQRSQEEIRKWRESRETARKSQEKELTPRQQRAIAALLTAASILQAALGFQEAWKI